MTPVKFINDYVLDSTKMLSRNQENIIKNYEYEIVKTNVTKVVRQCGDSTLHCGYLLYKLIYEDCNIACVGPQSIQHFDLMRDIIPHQNNSFPTYVDLPNHRILCNNSNIQFISNTEIDSLRGTTFDTIWFNGFDKMDNVIQVSNYAMRFENLNNCKIILSSLDCSEFSAWYQDAFTDLYKAVNTMTLLDICQDFQVGNTIETTQISLF